MLRRHGLATVTRAARPGRINHDREAEGVGVAQGEAHGALDERMFDRGPITPSQALIHEVLMPGRLLRRQQLSQGPRAGTHALQHLGAYD